jgi:hypothetical protein
VKVLVVGDSVSAALDYLPATERGIGKGYDVRFDLRVCRRLVSKGCPYQGSVPSSALDVVRAGGRGLGDVLVVDVGYNDDPALYGGQMAKVIRTAAGLGVKQIVWVTLRGTQPLYRRIDVEIHSEAARFPLVQVADWNAWSAGKPWFRDDGLHLTAAGADGLALLLRVYIVSAASAVRAGATS